MLTRATALTLAFVVTAMLGLGGIAPQPAQADDTGKILAGLAAGAVVYGLLDNADRDRDRDRDRSYYRDYDRDRYDRDRRGYYDGNRSSYNYDQRRRAEHQFDRHQDYRRHDSNRRAYNNGWNDGYDRGYDRGWDDGYDYGRSRSGWCY